MLDYGNTVRYLLHELNKHMDEPWKLAYEKGFEHGRTTITFMLSRYSKVIYEDKYFVEADMTENEVIQNGYMEFLFMVFQDGLIHREWINHADGKNEAEKKESLAKTMGATLMQEKKERVATFATLLGVTEERIDEALQYYLDQSPTLETPSDSSTGSNNARAGALAHPHSGVMLKKGDRVRYTRRGTQLWERIGNNIEGTILGKVDGRYAEMFNVEFDHNQGTFDLFIDEITPSTSSIRDRWTPQDGDQILYVDTNGNRPELLNKAGVIIGDETEVPGKEEPIYMVAISYGDGTATWIWCYKEDMFPVNLVSDGSNPTPMVTPEESGFKVHKTRMKGQPRDTPLEQYRMVFKDNSDLGDKSEDISDLEPGGVKADQGKLRWSLLPNFLVEPALKALQYGATKYAPFNWVALDPTRLLDAFTRHMTTHQQALHAMWKNDIYLDTNGSIAPCLRRHMAEKDGIDMAMPRNRNTVWMEMFDEESGLPHIDHALACLIMYRHVMVNGKVAELPIHAQIQQRELEENQNGR